jgi:hypothetical protein
VASAEFLVRAGSALRQVVEKENFIATIEAVAAEEADHSGASRSTTTSPMGHFKDVVELRRRFFFESGSIRAVDT